MENITNGSSFPTAFVLVELRGEKEHNENIYARFMLIYDATSRLSQN